MERQQKARKNNIGYHVYKERNRKENGLNIISIEGYQYFYQLLNNLYIGEINKQKH